MNDCPFRVCCLKLPPDHGRSTVASLRCDWLRLTPCQVPQTRQNSPQLQCDLEFVICSRFHPVWLRSSRFPTRWPANCAVGRRPTSAPSVVAPCPIPAPSHAVVGRVSPDPALSATVRSPLNGNTVDDPRTDTSSITSSAAQGRRSLHRPTDRRVALPPPPPSVLRPAPMTPSERFVKKCCWITPISPPNAARNSKGELALRPDLTLSQNVAGCRRKRPQLLCPSLGSQPGQGWPAHPHSRAKNDSVRGVCQACTSQTASRPNHTPGNRGVAQFSAGSPAPIMRGPACI